MLKPIYALFMRKLVLPNDIGSDFAQHINMNNFKIKIASIFHFSVLFNLFFFANTAIANTESSVSQDKPSAFDKLIEENGFVVPFPFEKLKDLLVSKGGKAQSVLIPFGRSIQKNYTDAENPRVVLAIGKNYDFTNRSPLEHKIFVGYSKNAKQLEIISDDGDKFQFLKVINYDEGKIPRIIKVPETACIGCHQSRGPIFSHFPWADTNEEDEVAEQIFKHQNGQTFYEGVPILNHHGAALNIERETSAANKLLQARSVIKSLCGLDIVCKKILLFTALTERKSSNFLTGFYGEARELRYDQEYLKTVKPSAYLLKNKNVILKYWPKHNFSTIDELISDKFNAAVFRAFLDPSAKRPLTHAIDINDAVIYLTDVLFEGFGLTENDAKLLSRHSNKKIFSAVSILPNKFFDLNWGSGREQIMQTVLMALNDSAGLKDCHCAIPQKKNFVPSNNNREHKEGESIHHHNKMEFNNTFEMLNFHCGKCHVEQSEIYPAIPFDNIVNFNEWLKLNKTTILTKLKTKQMPPANTNSEMSENFRSQIVQWLETTE